MSAKATSFLLLFDMDGVLLDSASAISESLRYALHQNGQLGFEDEDLTKYVGPPLAAMLNALLPNEPQNVRDQCAIDYRKHNNLHGPGLTALYEGMEDLLTEFSRDFQLRVATSKLESAAELVLRTKRIDHIFAGIHGSGPDGSDSKTDVMRRAVESALSHDKQIQVLAMIGDRKHDVEGAKNLGINSIGVTWGYAEVGELELASANYIVESPQQLKSLILQLAELAL